MGLDTFKRGSIYGNTIGLNTNRDKTFGNTYGILIHSYGLNKLPISITENVVSGNLKNGIYSNSDDLIIKNNYIGTTPLLQPGMGNGEEGIYLSGTKGVTIGGNGPNTIAFNKSHGVTIENATPASVAKYNLISKNRMFGNKGKGIHLFRIRNGWPQDSIPAPAITGVRSRELAGTAMPGAMVEVYQRDTGDFLQGKKFLGETRADHAGKWFLKGEFPAFCSMVAIAIDSLKNTSEFAPYQLNSNINNGLDTAALCTLRPTTLWVDAPFADVTWSTGEKTPAMVVQKGDRYFVTATDSCFFVSSDTIVIVEKDQTLKADFTYELNGSEATFISHSKGADNYRWKFDTGASSDLENPKHDFTVNKDYIVTLTVDNQCQADSVAKTVSITLAGVLDQQFNKSEVYPTVLGGSSTLNLISPDENLTFKLVRADGKVVQQGPEILQRGRNEIKLKGISCGVYILQIYSGGSIKNNHKIVVE